MSKMTEQDSSREERLARAFAQARDVWGMRTGRAAF
jgi:hypothetical protein